MGNLLINSVLFCFIMISVHAQENLLKIDIERMNKNDLCIQGYLSLNGKVVGYSLELPYVGNHDSASSIHPGTYIGKVKEGGRLGWRIELLDVEDRTNIQIHVGNIRDDSRGCILVGKDADVKNCSVSESKKTMDIIKEAFYSEGNSNKKITINISE